MKFLWQNQLVHRETVMFAGSRVGKLCFQATAIEQITNPCTGIVYQAGKDFLHTCKDDEIILSENSAIPSITQADIHLTGKCVKLRPAPDYNAIENAVDGGVLIFSEKGWFAENQVDVTYRSENIDFPVKLPDMSDRLPRLRSKLAQKENLTFSLIGDSISVGCNSTKFMEKFPFEPFYMEQFANDLSNRFFSEIKWINHAIGGTGIMQAQNIKEKYLADHADLLLIAYGMNNFAKLPVQEFIMELQRIIDESRRYNPNCEYLIISPMSGNPLWSPTRPGNDLIYAEALRKFTASAPQDVALADVNAAWQFFVKRKGFYSLTGNGVNHPNDYGHRIYASVLTSLF